MGHRRNSKDALLDWNRKLGTANALDTVVVRHVSGGSSTILFKSYDQGRGKWQANTVHVVWFDEEPPFDVYSEGRTRTTATQGIILVTFTPLQGISQVVKRFLNEKSESRAVIVMTIRDAQHIPEKERDRIIADYPAHERDARANGVPTMGAGAVFPVADDDLLIDPIPIPNGGGGSGFGFRMGSPDSRGRDRVRPRTRRRVYRARVSRETEDRDRARDGAAGGGSFRGRGPTTGSSTTKAPAARS